ncbi:MAG: chromosome partitioning protein ParA [Sphingobacteriales bacterium 41-5]|nr:MAG: chromosome partitioning protein ParA [Sphingobacteriales bacterium 41-5]
MAGITLTIDIGGSKIKAATFDKKGKMIHDYTKLLTPQPATPEAVIDTIKKLVEGFKFDQISSGFPGYVRDGIVHTAPNLGTESWANVNLAQKLTEALGKPAKVVNDADMLGLGSISGKGLEMMVTLGTGVGTALYLDGKLLPHLEVSHHPLADGKDYDQYVGEAEHKKIGNKKWNKRMKFVFEVLKTVFNYDKLYIGGGLAKKLDFPLDDNMIVVTNKMGIDGGVKLW